MLKTDKKYVIELNQQQHIIEMGRNGVGKIYGNMFSKPMSVKVISPELITKGSIMGVTMLEKGVITLSAGHIEDFNVGNSYNFNVGELKEVFNG